MVRLKARLLTDSTQAFGAAALPESSGSSTLLCGTRQRRREKGLKRFFA
jgi:hypothetical protein